MACKMTKKQFDKGGVDYVTAIASVEQIDEFKSAGLLSFPVVVVDCGDGAVWRWSGFRPGEINTLIDLTVSEAAA